MLIPIIIQLQQGSVHIYRQKLATLHGDSSPDLCCLSVWRKSLRYQLVKENINCWLALAVVGLRRQTLWICAMLYHTDPWRTVGYWPELYGLFHRHFNVNLLVFETGIYWDFLWPLKIKRYENDMVTVFWIQFMIFYTKDAMSPSQCPTAPG